MNWKYGENEYVKIFRKLINWEWFTDVNTCHLFVYCLLKANWKDGSWKGIAYKRGQFITSLETMSQETGLSVRKVRTALKHLILTNEVTNQVTSNYRLISVVNYDLYQSKRQTERQGDDKAVTKQRQSDDNSIRNIKNNKEVEEYNMASPEDEDEEGYVVPRRGEDGEWIV
jgi:hypothetical protein